MNIRIIILVVYCLSELISYSQTDDNMDLKTGETNRYSLYTEVYIINPSKHDFGYPSINYERYFCCVPGLSIKIGASSDFNTHFALPFSLNYLTHQISVHHLEIGMGAVLSLNELNDKYYNTVNAFAIFLPIMYRYQKQNGILFRAGFNTYFGQSSFVAPSLSVGYNF